MKCPYRKDTNIIYNGTFGLETERIEHFANCNGKECPFYHWRGDYNNPDFEGCRKAEAEIRR